MIKRLTINFLIIFMIFMGVIYGYTQSFSLSKFDWFSYAEADNWSSCESSDLVTAFRYYCKSRNLAIEGSVADALTGFTTTTFNNICSTLGIDTTTLQAELKKTTDGNLGLRFLFSRTGITAYNRIFAEFLQNNNLSVGDEVDNLNVYSGEQFIAPDGQKCIVFVMKNGNASATSRNDVLQFGTILYNGSYFTSLFNSGVTSFNFYNYSYPITKTNIDGNYFTTKLSGNRIDGYSTGSPRYPLYDNGFIIVRRSDGVYQSAVMSAYKRASDNTEFFNIWAVRELKDISADDIEDANVNLTTNNTTINNNTYNNNYTIIYNDGDTYVSDDDDEPQPDTPPDGGGGGDDPSGDPDPTPSGPDLPDWQPPSGTGTIGSDGTFDFDLPFSLPNLNIDWSLKDIGHKFPFCIPSDIVSFYQTLAVEPRAPSIDAHIPLGSFYDWHFVADFSQYDRWAVIIRAVEYVGFVIGLIYFTVRLVKG